MAQKQINPAVDTPQRQVMSDKDKELIRRARQIPWWDSWKTCKLRDQAESVEAKQEINHIGCMLSLREEYSLG